MQIGPKYKIAKRLGAAVFEKTQTAKFAVRAEKKNASSGGMRGKSNFGIQLLEKQKVKYTYAVTAKQLKNYVRAIISAKVKNPEAKLFDSLERRLDNVILRSGLATTRLQARQIVNHGHMRVNDKKTSVPSFRVKKGDIITLKESDKTKPLFADFKERTKDQTSPSWLKVDANNFTITVSGDPEYKGTELPFNLGEVIQFYKR